MRRCRGHMVCAGTVLAARLKRATSQTLFGEACFSVCAGLVLLSGSLRPFCFASLSGARLVSLSSCLPGPGCLCGSRFFQLVSFSFWWFHQRESSPEPTPFQVSFSYAGIAAATEVVVCIFGWLMACRITFISGPGYEVLRTVFLTFCTPVPAQRCSGSFLTPSLCSAFNKNDPRPSTRVLIRDRLRCPFLGPSPLVESARQVLEVTAQ